MFKEMSNEEMMMCDGGKTADDGRRYTRSQSAIVKYRRGKRRINTALRIIFKY